MGYIRVINSSTYLTQMKSWYPLLHLLLVSFQYIFNNQNNIFNDTIIFIINNYIIGARQACQLGLVSYAQGWWSWAQFKIIRLIFGFGLG